MVKITLAQLDLLVGDIRGNCDTIIQAITEAKKQQSDLIVFPELAITGYPLEDLLHRSSLYDQAEKTLSKILPLASGIDILIGYPEKNGQEAFNSAVWIRDKKIITKYHKQKLPNYSVFDEKRYFTSGDQASIVELKGIKFGILICEDLWDKAPGQLTKSAGAECLLVLNASPFSSIKRERRLATLKTRIAEIELPIAYVNLIGAQDELVFDGNSMALNADGKVAAMTISFDEELLTVEINENKKFVQQKLPSPLSKSFEIYEALALGIKDYINKNNFPGVIIGLSGGIDSALTLTLAVDALGANNVTAVFMPSEFSSDLSAEEAKNQANTLGVEFHIIPIETIKASFLKELNPVFGNKAQDVTEENLQARIRGVILMALSNKTGRMVVSTGNKSENAVGYSTLYGDMVGGFDALKDISKTIVYQLAKYRNSISPVIPQRVIDRPPSAELAPNQCDQDTLPPYDILDGILELFVEQDKTVPAIVAAGYELETVKKVLKMVLRNEYKRRQGAPGVRITEKAFGRDRRYPITSGYQPWDDDV